jgi:hypothetical protein
MRCHELFVGREFALFLILLFIYGGSVGRMMMGGGMSEIFRYHDAINFR